jgi:hypothetical protein
MRALLWIPVVVALLVQPAEARSRDFSAPPVTDAAPLPRSGPVSLSFALGANYLLARWREYDPSLGTTQSTNGGPAVQLRFGVPIRERVALFIQGDLSVLVIPGNSPWLATSGFGVGATVFLPDCPWYLEAGMRRAAAGTITDVGVGRRIPLVANISGVWFGEIGLGHATRRARVDSGPALSLFGGLMNPDGSSGWGIGTSLLYGWSRY